MSGARRCRTDAATGDWRNAAAYFAWGVLIDLDHLADYWREDGFNTNVKRFLGFFDARLPKRQWLFLHGWEWVALAFVAALSPQAPSWWVWAAQGWLTHLILDQFSNGLKPYAYFFYFRAKHGFVSKELYA